MILIPQPPFFAGLSGYVAELGASYLMADLGLAYTPRPDHAAYLASWLTALRHDPKAIFNAAAQAQAAPTGSTRRIRRQ
jgi:antirestriction protein ArdC